MGEKISIGAFDPAPALNVTIELVTRYIDSLAIRALDIVISFESP